jgi:hypothetical protein
MPYVRLADGSWSINAGGAADVESTTARLVIVDTQVDTDGFFRDSLAGGVISVVFDSKVKNGFVSILF